MNFNKNMPRMAWIATLVLLVGVVVATVARQDDGSATEALVPLQTDEPGLTEEDGDGALVTENPVDIVDDRDTYDYSQPEPPDPLRERANIPDFSEHASFVDDEEILDPTSESPYVVCDKLPEGVRVLREFVTAPSDSDLHCLVWTHAGDLEDGDRFEDSDSGLVVTSVDLSGLPRLVIDATGEARTEGTEQSRVPEAYNTALELAEG